MDHNFDDLESEKMLDPCAYVTSGGLGFVAGKFCVANPKHLVLRPIFTLQLVNPMRFGENMKIKVQRFRDMKYCTKGRILENHVSRSGRNGIAFG